MYFVRLIKLPLKRTVNLPSCGQPAKLNSWTVPGTRRCRSKLRAEPACFWYSSFFSGVAPCDCCICCFQSQLRSKCVTAVAVRAKIVNVPDVICRHTKLICVSHHQTFEHLVLGQFGSLHIELVCMDMGALSPLCSTKLCAAAAQQMPQHGVSWRWSCCCVRVWFTWGSCAVVLGVLGLVPPPSPLPCMKTAFAKCVFTKWEFRILLYTGFWASDKEMLLINDTRIE